VTEAPRAAAVVWVENWSELTLFWTELSKLHCPSHSSLNRPKLFVLVFFFLHSFSGLISPILIKLSCFILNSSSRRFIVWCFIIHPHLMPILFYFLFFTCLRISSHWFVQLLRQYRSLLFHFHTVIRIQLDHLVVISILVFLPSHFVFMEQMLMLMLMIKLGNISYHFVV